MTLPLIRQGLLCAMLATCLIAPAAMADGPNPPENTITTQGNGEITVPPDSLSVSLTVQGEAPTMEKAREENNRKMNQVQAAVKQLNLPGLKLKTQNYSVYPVYKTYENGRLSKVVGYHVNNSLNVQVLRAGADQLGEYGGRILDTALAQGITNTSGLNFFIDDKESAQAKALSAAMTDARRNADILARAAGVTVSGVFSIEGYPQFSSRPYPMPMMARAMADGGAAMEKTQIEVGDSTVNSQVTVRFRY
ncbi:MAG: SIMPL domain-containing protein [Candidatus Melainabacteria bacterium]